MSASGTPFGRLAPGLHGGWGEGGLGGGVCNDSQDCCISAGVRCLFFFCKK